MTSRCFARKRIGRPPIVAPGFRANELTVANKFLAGLSVAAALAPDRGPSARPPVRGCRAANGAEVEARYAQRELLFGPKATPKNSRFGICDFTGIGCLADSRVRGERLYRDDDRRIIPARPV